MWLAFFGSSFASVPGGSSPRCAAARPTGTGYLQFLLPGVLSTSMLIDRDVRVDEHHPGQAVRFHEAHSVHADRAQATVYLSKALGSATRGMVQIPVMLVAALVFGVRFQGDLADVGRLAPRASSSSGFGFSAFFLAVTASSTDWQTPGVISNFITMPLMFASGALFPSQNYPAWMQAIAYVNPVGFSALLGRGVMVNGTANWLYLGYLGIFAALMMGVGTLVASKYLKVE